MVEYDKSVVVRKIVRECCLQSERAFSFLFSFSLLLVFPYRSSLVAQYLQLARRIRIFFMLARLVYVQQVKVSFFIFFYFFLYFFYLFLPPFLLFLSSSLHNNFIISYLLQQHTQFFSSFFFFFFLFLLSLLLSLLLHFPTLPFTVKCGGAWRRSTTRPRLETVQNPQITIFFPETLLLAFVLTTKIEDNIVSWFN